MDNAEELEVRVRKRSMQDYWKKAKEILHRIQLIEKEHNKVGLFTKVGSNLSKSLWSLGRNR